VWQDYVLMAANVVFCLTVVPMLFAREKPPLWTSIPTTVVLWVIGATYLTLQFWFATATLFIVGTEWSVLAYQKWQQPRTS